MSDFPITIYHNPDCGTSRNTLGIILAAGYDPTVIEYLQTGWTRSQLEGILAATNLHPRVLLREKGTPAVSLGLLEASATDAEILEAMVAHPILVNRPIVITPLGAKLSRPSEAVLSLLEREPANFTKEDGTALPL